jgi:hypothetical protein
MNCEKLMETKKSEILVVKKKAMFFTNNVSIRKVFLLTPWAPGITGQVLGGKLFGTQNLEGTLYLTNQRLRFETGKFDKSLGLGDLEFDIALKEIEKVSVGRKIFKKTMILLVDGVEIEFSIFGVGGFIEALTRQIQFAF